MTLALASRLTFSSPAAERIRAAERAAVARMAPPEPPAPVQTPPAKPRNAPWTVERLIPPPSAGPLYEGWHDSPVPAQPLLPDWWTPEVPLPRFPSISSIQRAVCAAFEIRMVELVSERRFKEWVLPRQVAMYLCKVMSPRSLPDIGRRFGGRDHTTVLHAVRKIEALIQTDPDIAATIAEIRSRFEVNQDAAGEVA